MSGLRRMSLIVAVDVENGIGKNGKIPWAIKKDMAFFAQQTAATKDEKKVNAVLMGRKCWESIPEKFRPLKNRLNIVCSRSMPEQRSENLIVTPDFDGILAELTRGPLADRVEKIWNIGGGEIYNMALQKELIEQIVITKIQSSFEADVKLDSIDWENFREDESKRSELHTENEHNFVFHVYDRIAA